MKFRPCIDIHNGQVKQIIGGTLTDQDDKAEENFVSDMDAAFFASKYKKDELTGGHIIILNPQDSQYYEADCAQAYAALAAFPGGMQAGGGIDATNAGRFIEAGASHIIVTSYVFRGGQLNMKNLNELKRAVGRRRIVLDLSCRRRGDGYYIVTDRWQKFTDMPVTCETMEMLSEHCDEFLVHAVDVEGRSAGIDIRLAEILGGWKGLPVTYAGGVRSIEDLELLRQSGMDRLDVTIGSALDIFGGSLRYEDVRSYCNPPRV